MNYQTQKTAELRKIAGEQNIKGSEEMERKDLITALKEQDKEPVPEPEKEPEEEAEETPSNQEEEVETEEDGEDSPVKEEAIEPEKTEPAKIITGIMGSRVPINSKAARMKEKLSKQNKVRILIPLDGDKFGATTPVTLNGYRMNILKGIYVEVPMQVADIIADSQQQTLKALEGPMRKFAQDGLPMKFDGDVPGALN